MRIMVVIPIEHYDAFLTKCDTSRPEYSMLRNGIISKDAAGKAAVEIPSDLAQAERLLDLARSIHPAAAPSIEESIRLSRGILEPV